MVPELRFGEFEEEWLPSKLDKIAQLSKGKGISKGQRVEGGNTPCILYGELYTTYSELIDKTVSFTNIPTDELVMSEGNEVIIPASGETREDIATASCILRKSVGIGGDLNIIRSPLNGLFLAYYLNGKRSKDIARLAQGSSVMHLYGTQLKSLHLNVPTLPEQKKIADFLSAVDTRIQHLSRKKELLEQYKKGVMQKLFSQELRFKRPDGTNYPDWEEKRLGEIATFKKGKGISKGDIEVDGAIPCIRYGELYTTYQETISTVYSRTNIPREELFFSMANDIIIPSSGETHIDLATASCVLEEGIALGGDLNVIRTENNGVFLSYYLNSAKKIAIAKLAQGNSVVHLYSTHLKGLKLDVPSKEEQQKIADFLSALDKKIEAVSTQIAKTQQFKKGLLQKMFV